MSIPSNSPGHKNRLLAALPDEAFLRLLPSLETISLNLKDILYEPDQPIEYIYFPLSGMVSVLVILDDKTFIEVGVVGNEGIVGLPVFLGAETTTTKAICQVDGEAVRLTADTFKAEIEQDGALVPLLKRYTQAYLTMLGQISACNSLHLVHERCARWLLTVHDRVGQDEFTLTQEFLSQMLGVRRTGVNEVMQTLQRAGHIRYSWGTITILDRAGLESSACKCYHTVVGEYRRLLG
jgi:CRP-like cAMP-binding protein